MKVYCPDCERVVPATGIQLGIGWAVCGRCDEVFSLADLLPEFPRIDHIPEPPPPIEQPFNARVIVERTCDVLLIHVPREGWRASSVAAACFATFWLGFVTSGQLVCSVCLTARTRMPIVASSPRSRSRFGSSGSDWSALSSGMFGATSRPVLTATAC